jgi:hypothetical protein
MTHPGPAIRAMREALGLSLRQLSDTSKTSTSYLSLVNERKERVPSPNVWLRAVEEALAKHMLNKGPLRREPATTDVDLDLAASFGITVKKLHELRKRHHWPFVRLGRFEIRFTDEQVREIVAAQSVAPATKQPEVGLTARSANRRRSDRQPVRPHRHHRRPGRARRMEPRHPAGDPGEPGP